MYDYFKGILERIDGNTAVIDVNGIGYRVNCTLPDIGALSMLKGNEVKLFLHLVHKEDSMTLYGFLTEESRKGYEALLKVGGIGPRTALNMLSRCDIAALAQSIENDDVSILKKIPGIGEKTAKKIILDLKGKLGDLVGEKVPEDDHDLVAAMISMGYSENEVLKCYEKTKPFSGDFSADIKKFLKMMG